MVIFKTVADIQAYIAKQKAEKKKIGFVPTMGALHKGHISLVEKAKQDGAFVVASIFINPTQFNDKEDFDKYPVTTGQDILMLTEAGCDVLLLPSVAEMYPEGSANMQSYNFGYLETMLEGAHRPGHFKGVGQIVARLLDIVKPDAMYMGQKDYQQCMVVTNLLSQLYREQAPEMVICPTTREQDGLAMSSRNRRLTEPQRALAGRLYQCLVSIQAKQSDKFSIVQKECNDLLMEKGFDPDYIALADANNLTLLEEYEPNRKMVALIAAKLGNVRLIDNMIINPDSN
ncbi:MAG: pantoate--beta-alanine ligase [Sphingobacteriales bacterium]|nr:MAG: pantoate--beta-alanine ligase [Sphingobacteriales bacterium]